MAQCSWPTGNSTHHSAAVPSSHSHHRSPTTLPRRAWCGICTAIVTLRWSHQRVLYPVKKFVLHQYAPNAQRTATLYHTTAPPPLVQDTQQETPRKQANNSHSSKSGIKQERTASACPFLPTYKTHPHNTQTDKTADHPLHVPYCVTLYCTWYSYK